MASTFETPWGETYEHGSIPDDFPVRWLAFAHWQAGHRYRVDGVMEGRLTVTCDCGATATSRDMRTVTQFEVREEEGIMALILIE